MQNPSANIEVSAVPTADLQSKYGITKSTLYKRLESLDIEPYKKGTRSFILGNDVELLDRFDRWIRDGGSAKTFEKPVRIPRAEIVSISSNSSQETNEILILIEAISRHFAKQSTDPIANVKALVYLADNLIIVPTSKVRELIGIKPRGDIYQWGSFIFERRGKLGRESGWSVTK